MEENARQIILTSKIGDGHLAINGKNAYAVFSSVLCDYMKYKHDVLSNEFKCSDVKLKDNSAGFNKHGIIYYINTNTDAYMTKVLNMSKIEVINQLDYFGFLIYYFDDGAYHKTHHIMHIYCNSFNKEEVQVLRNKIFELFPYKMCTVRADRKKDGS